MYVEKLFLALPMFELVENNVKIVHQIGSYWELVRDCIMVSWQNNPISWKSKNHDVLSHFFRQIELGENIRNLAIIFSHKHENFIICENF